MLCEGFLQLWRAGATSRWAVYAQVAVAHGLNCSAYCGIFLDGGIELMSPALEHRFYLVCHQGIPRHQILIVAQSQRNHIMKKKYKSLPIYVFIS